MEKEQTIEEEIASHVVDTRAYQDFKSVLKGFVNEWEFLLVLGDEIEHIMQQNKGTSWSDAIAEAVNSMKRWYSVYDRHNLELRYEEIAAFVARRRRAATWCMVTRMAHEEGQLAHPDHYL